MLENIEKLFPLKIGTLFPDRIFGLLRDSISGALPDSRFVLFPDSRSGLLSERIFGALPDSRFVLFLETKSTSLPDSRRTATSSARPICVPRLLSLSAAAAMFCGDRNGAAGDGPWGAIKRWGPAGVIEYDGLTLSGLVGQRPTADDRPRRRRPRIAKPR